MKKDISYAVIEELIDMDELLKHKHQGFYEMQNEDYFIADYINPFEYMSDLHSDARSSIRYFH